MSFPGRGRRVLNPEERPVLGPLAAQARSHQDSCLDPQGLCQRAKLGACAGNDTAVLPGHFCPHCVVPRSPRGVRGCISQLVAPACLHLPPHLPWLQERGLQHILSRDTELQPRLLVRRVTRVPAEDLATRPEASSVSAAARLLRSRPFHCKLSVVWVTDQVFTLGEDQR